MKTILILLGCFFSFIGKAQTTTILDPNFEQALINLGLDNVVDGSVLTASIDTVTYLYVPYDSIADLTGIQAFTALTKLDCYGNQLTSLDVTQNFNLIRLNCRSNQLSSLDLSQNNLLEILFCYANQLTSLDLTQNMNLYIIDCSGNALINLNVTQCNALLNLNCGANMLQSLDLSQNNALKWLNCGSNQLSTLNVTQNDSLVGLVCHVNPLGNIDVSNNALLQHLDCDFNELTTLDVSQNPFLTLLYCMDNQLMQLDASNNIYLERLACYNNQINCLNLKNGNNANMSYFGAFNNPNLNCIEVDDPIAFGNIWNVSLGFIDSQMYYSSYCGNSCTTGLEELDNSQKQLLKIVDVTGRETEYEPNKVLLYIYTDGTVERLFHFE